jgi:hypothetical protein
MQNERLLGEGSSARVGSFPRLESSMLTKSHHFNDIPVPTIHSTTKELPAVVQSTANGSIGTDAYY